MAENIDFLADSGVHGFIVFGCMGKFYAPKEREFDQIVNVVVDAAAGSIAKVMLNRTSKEALCQLDKVQMIG